MKTMCDAPRRCVAHQDDGMKKVAIIGGDIAGLATAYYLHERGRGAIDYTLIESAPLYRLVYL